MNDVAEIIAQNEDQIRSEWVREMPNSVQRADLISKTELQEQCRALLGAVIAGVRSSGTDNLTAGGWNTTRDVLQEISSSRARQGFSPADVAMFVLSLKRPLFTAIRRNLSDNPDKLFDAVWTATQLLDRLALITTETFMSVREELISRQQQELLELSTPVVKLWDGILALPIIGTLDSARTQVVMENLLQTVVATNSKFAIIDITGVPTVDTLVAQHLLKTITAARLMGAECIISGVRPQIAQTIVHLGINLEDVITKAKLSDAFALALQRSGRNVVRVTVIQRPEPDRQPACEAGGVMERIPVLRMGSLLLITIQVDMHDKLALQLQDDVTERHLRVGIDRGAHRHLIARNRRFVHWQNAGEHRGHVASFRSRHRGGRHATGGRHHSG